MRPQEHSLAASRVIADGSNQMRGPDPRTGEKDDHVDLLVVLHLLKSVAGLIFRRHHDIVLHHFQARLGKSFLGALYDGIIDERDSHRVFEAIFVNTVDDESDSGLNQQSSLWVAKSECATMAARSTRYRFT